ncbi:MAG: amidohydrolase family protein [Vicinamibacteria bacterium]
MFRFTLLISTLWTLSAAASLTSAAASPQSSSLLLVGATVIDGTGAPPLANAWIRIEEDRIAEIGQGPAPPARGAEVLELGGKTVLPGLGDMHVHLGELSQARWMLKLLLAHGVTNVKETGNRLGNLAAIRAWMAEEESPLPHLYLSGATINGDAGDLQFLKEGSETQSRLEDNLAFGVSFIKIHNWISSQALKQIAAFAKEHDHYLTGHVPLSMTSVAAIDAGMTILEHVRLRPGEVLDDPEAVSRFPIDLLVMERTAYWADLNLESDVLASTLDAWEKRKDRFFFDPTLVVHWALAHADGPTATEALELVSPAMLARWRRGTERYGQLDAEEYARAKKAAEVSGQFVALAHKRGIRITSGTDTAVNGVIPGHSLHQELELLVKGGLTPVEAIRSSTGRVAEALRAADRGTIAPRMQADLLIVDGDVAANIDNVRKIEKVILGGRVLERTRLLDEAKKWAAEDRSVSETSGNY